MRGLRRGKVTWLCLKGARPGLERVQFLDGRTALAREFSQVLILRWMGMVVDWIQGQDAGAQVFTSLFR